jgi:hypothetical protein
MTTVPVTSPGGDNEALESTPSGSQGGPGEVRGISTPSGSQGGPGGVRGISTPSGSQGGPGEVEGISDLAQRIVTATYLGHPRLHRGLVIVVGVLIATCVIAVATRLSPLPLLPVPLLAVAAYALRRIRSTKDNHRLLLGWSALFLLATLIGFWLISVVARWVD